MAKSGDPDAENGLGMAYLSGTGVAQDDSEGVKWFRRAAAHRSARAQNNLGVMYREGRGVPEDAAQAFRLFRKSAEGGEIRGQYNLANAYYFGQGVASNQDEAIKWYMVGGGTGALRERRVHRQNEKRQGAALGPGLSPMRQQTVSIRLRVGNPESRLPEETRTGFVSPHMVQYHYLCTIC
jgi:hypothetical protein